MRLYFDRLRLWYRVTNLEDEIIGPLVAGRLYGKAGKIALALKVPSRGKMSLAEYSVEFET